MDQTGAKWTVLDKSELNWTKLELMTCIFYYKLYLGSRMCKVMIVKSDGSIMIDKLQLVLRIYKNIIH